MHESGKAETFQISPQGMDKIHGAAEENRCGYRNVNCPSVLFGIA